MFDPDAPLPRFAELTEMGRRLSRNGRYKGLSSAIASAGRAMSCLSDVRRAGHCCEGLRHRPIGVELGPEIEGAIEGALLAHAVALYSRATVTGQGKGERGSINITDRLAPEQRTDHLLIAAVRNRGGAHVYPNEIAGSGIWHGSNMLGVEMPSGGWLPFAVVEEVMFDRELFEALQRQIPVADNLILETYIKFLRRIEAMMNADPVDGGMFGQCSVNAVAYFGSEEAVRHALDGIEAGAATGIKRW